MTLEEVQYCSAKFLPFGLPNGIFQKTFISVLVLFFARIQIHRNLCSFLIGNESTSRASLEIHHFSAKFHRFGLLNGIFWKFLLQCSFFSFYIGIQIPVNLCSFSIGNGSTSRTLQEIHHFSAKFHRFSLLNGIFKKKFVSLLVFFFFFVLEFIFTQI